MNNFVTKVIAILTLIGMVFSVFFFLDSQHAKQRELVLRDLRIREKMIDTDIKKWATDASYYRNTRNLRDLEPAEKSRLEYLEEQLELKYTEHHDLEQQILEIENNQ